MEPEEQESHQQEGWRTGFVREGGYSASEGQSADREVNDTEDMGSQHNSSHLMQINSEAKGKGKARSSPRAGHKRARTLPVIVEDTEDTEATEGTEGTLKGRNNRGSAANINEEPRQRIRRVRSSGHLRRVQSTKALGMPRGGQVSPKKRHEEEQNTGTRPGPHKSPLVRSRSQ